MENNAVTTLTATSPLAGYDEALSAASSDILMVEEKPLLTQINVRGDASDKAFLDGIRKAIGFALPTGANQANEKGDTAALWLGPDEWLVISTENDPQRLVSSLRVMTSDKHVSIIDVSDNRTCLSLSGKEAWAVMNKLSRLDFHPRSWKKGQCAQTTIGRAQVIIWQRNRKPVFDILMRNSFARYVADFAMDAMLEFKA